MMSYLKSIALLAGLYCALTAGTYATTRTDVTTKLAKASAHLLCGHGLASACRTVARFRVDRSAPASLKS